jgi:hypothetical protein
MEDKELITILENIDSLTATERQAFEKKIQTDSFFAEKVAYLMATKKILQENHLIEIDAERSKRFQSLRTQAHPFNQKNKIFAYIGVSIAACIVFVVGYWWLYEKPIIRENNVPTLMKDSITIKKDSVKLDSTHTNQ